MKRGVLFLSLFLFAAVVPPAWSAPDSTERLLEATRVEDVLQLRLTKEADKAAVVSYEIDGHDDGILHDQDTFGASGAVDISYREFNPLRVATSATETSAPDPVQAAIDQASAQLAAVAKLVVPPSTTTGGTSVSTIAEAPSGCVQVALQVRDQVRAAKLAEELAAIEKALVTELAEITKQAEKEGKAEDPEKKKAAEARAEAKKKAAVTSAEAAGAAAFEAKLRACAQCEAVAKKLGTVGGSVEIVSQAAQAEPPLAAWVEDATGLAGVTRTRLAVAAETERRIENRNKAVVAQKAAEEALQQLIEVFPRCSFGAQELIRVQALPPKAQAAVDRENGLIASLNALQALLQANEQRRWRNQDRDVVIYTTESDPANVKTPTVALRFVRYSFDKNKGVIVAAADPETKRTFDVRRSRRLVTEYGVAGVYNDLRYPKYTVRTEADGKKVTRGFDDSNVNLAATLNFLCPSCIGHGLYAGFQLGISKAKDYPGLLGGGVLRFGGNNRLAIASGVMVTWYKDLDKLKVDGAVESEDALKNDLKLRRSPTAWYLAVQYTF